MRIDLAAIGIGPGGWAGSAPGHRQVRRGSRICLIVGRRTCRPRRPADVLISLR